MREKIVLLLSLFVLTTITFTGCNSEIDSLSPEASVNFDDSDIKIVQNKLLQFKDMETYKKVLDSFSAMTTLERLAFLDSLSFESQLSLMTKADLELDEMCDLASDEKEFYTQYADYKQKYKDVFMFNDIENDDLSPYSRLINLEHEFFANADGNFMIGDSVVHAPKFQSYKDFAQKNIITRAASNFGTEVNHAWSHTKDRKVGLYLSMDKSGAIFARFTAQKKYIFGWKRYSTMYSAKFNIKGHYDQKFFFLESAFTGGPIKSVLMDGLTFTVNTKELGGNETLRFGNMGGPVYPSPLGVAYAGEGWMEVWSRGVSYENRGKANVQVETMKF